MGAPSSDARGVNRGKSPRMERASVGSGSHIGEGGTGANDSWCEEKCVMFVRKGLVWIQDCDPEGNIFG